MESAPHRVFANVVIHKGCSTKCDLLMSCIRVAPKTWQKSGKSGVIAQFLFSQLPMEILETAAWRGKFCDGFSEEDDQYGRIDGVPMES